MKKNYVLTYTLSLLILVLAFRAGAQCGTPSNAPYFEGFAGITTNNQFPACWAASNPSVTCLTFTGSGGPGGTNRGAFLNSPLGNNYFYSGGIQLNAGVIYSVSAWYALSASSSGWAFSILLGTSQSTTALMPITPAAFGSPSYASVSNTFSISTTGTYYIAIKGTSSAGASQYLYFDDLRLEVPCAVNPHTLSVNGPTAACQGQPFSYTLTGADTYTWMTGAQGPVLTFIPGPGSPNISVAYTKTITGCTYSFNTPPIIINPTPNISVFTPNPTHAVCEGSSAVLTAFGSATGYTWSSTGLPGSTTTVTPLSNTVYTVLGKSSEGCMASATIDINVNPLPTVSVTASNTMPCAGETVTLSGTGAFTYTWMQGANALTGASITITPTVPTVYVITGTNNNGCINSSNFNMNVATCTGIHASANSEASGIYPNPNNGRFTVKLNGPAVKTINVIDLTGRVLASETTDAATLDLDISRFANGLYYAKITTAGTTETIKIIKK